ncbi:MAG TPA: glycosyltransferase [Candidatus Dormibacteraeota bacterium]
MSVPRVSIVIPAYNEGEQIVACLDRVLAAVTYPCEVLVVYDRPDDTTASPAQGYARADPRVRPLVNPTRPGPAAAIRYGLRESRAPVVVVTMADGSDQPSQIEALADLVEGGAVIAAASRYMRGGRQVGGPFLKGLMSRTAGVSLYWLARVGTHDATNSFKAYSKAFLETAGVESDAGFEMGIEMVAKARRQGARVAELPTVWLDRTSGQSNFKVRQWIPRYLHWYLVALLPFYGARNPQRS